MILKANFATFTTFAKNTEKVANITLQYKTLATYAHFLILGASFANFVTFAKKSEVQKS